MAGILLFGRLPGLAVVPGIYILADMVLFDAVALLDLAFKLISLAGDLV